MERSSPGRRVAGFGRIQTSATLGDDFEPEHSVDTSSVAWLIKQKIASDGT